jgi:hypothetical protein
MKTKPWIPIAAILGLVGMIATVAVAAAAFSKETDEPMNTLPTDGTPQPVAVPPMDADAPAKTETATFALG